MTSRPISLVQVKMKTKTTEMDRDKPAKSWDNSQMKVQRIVRLATGTLYRHNRICTLHAAAFRHFNTVIKIPMSSCRLKAMCSHMIL